MRLAILYNGEHLARWQRRALELLTPDHELHFLIARGIKPAPRSVLKYFSYYLINVASIRNSQSKPTGFLPPADAADRTFEFTPGYQGDWATLPEAVQTWLRESRIDAVIKFDLGLLRVPESAPPILSWHHGDPERFRGRPAGFYELVQGEAFIGQMVQRLTDSLDAGEILAFAETRVHPHSYRKTLTEAFALSPYLLGPALEALRLGQRVQRGTGGRNYRLPSNLSALRMIARSGLANAKRVLYGAFVEKRWRVSTSAMSPEAGIAEEIARIERGRASWKVFAPPRGFTFLADPFFGTDPDELFVEGLDATSGKGRILRLAGDRVEPLQTAEAFHLSYPGSLEESGVRYILPEMAKGGPQAAYRLEGSALQLASVLQIEAGPILDPTFVAHEGRVYLFANRQAEGPAILRLWSATGLFERFSEHPASPIRISARGSRMAGGIARFDDRLVRFGQDVRRSYGDGLLAFAIEELSAESYRERLIGEGAFTGIKGPHTLNLRDGIAVFDWYEECVSLLAGVRRVRARMS